MSGVGITGLIKPLNGGSFPVWEDIDGLGGFRAVADTTARDAIPANFRKVGMVVAVSAGTSYQLVGGIANANWVVYAAPLAIKYNSVAQTQEPAINFLGTAVTVSDNPGIATNITIQSLGQVVADLPARNAIPAANRQVGSAVYEVDTDQTWRLFGGVTNGNWTDITVYPVSNTTQGVVPSVGGVSTILQSTSLVAAWVIPLSWDQSIISPTIKQFNQTTNGVNGQPLNINAQNSTGTATIGGGINITTGTGTSSQGVLKINIGATQIGQFGLATTDFLTFGIQAGRTGYIRVPAGLAIVGRDFADTADLVIYQSATSSTNTQTYGSALNSTTVIDGSIAGGIQLRTGGTQRVAINNTGVFVAVPLLQFQPQTSVSQVISIVNTASTGTQLDLIVRAQGSSNASANGGTARIQGGKSGTTGIAGGVVLQVNVDDTSGNMVTMLECRSLIAQGGTLQRVTALNRGSDITTTQMPAGSGDLVTYVGNAASVPTVDAVSGFVLYSDGGKPAMRYNGTNLRFNGTSVTASTGALAAVPALPAGYLDMQINGAQQKVAYYAA